MNNKIRGLLFGSFIGDAFSLGAHWDYNPSRIKRKHGRITDYISPESNQYHSLKKTGDFTHYGDQTLILLESISERKKLDLADFFKKWRRLFSDYNGYIDGATSDTLKNFSEKKPIEKVGSLSNDMAGAGRIAPLFTAYGTEQAEDLFKAVRLQTALTHGEANVVDAAEFFARIVLEILAGNSILHAIETAAEHVYAHLPAREWLEKARESVEEDSVEAVKALGQDCHMPHIFPATLLLLLKHDNDFETCLIKNVMAGGDSAARGLILGMILGAAYGVEAIPKRWIDGLQARLKIESYLKDLEAPVANTASERRKTHKTTFVNSEGLSLNARLETPAEKPRVYALFAHCFTCSKDVIAASRISRALSDRGIAVLRFDFTGLGNSDGDFANTDFSSNIQDLIAAANHLRRNYEAPTLLIGHSLGGAAVLAAGLEIPEIKGVVTIAAPSDPLHVTHLFKDKITEIEGNGFVEVNLAGRSFTIKKRFLDDVREQKLLERLALSRQAFLIMHSPVDKTVSIDHARKIFEAVKHPKSFVSLHPADHMLSNKNDSIFVAEIVSAWANRVAT